MSSRLNLNDNTNSTFEFSIGGKDYDLKYPTMQDIAPIQDLTKQRDAVEKSDKLSEEEKTKRLGEINDLMEAEMYKMIIPVGHNTPIKEVLQTQPFPVVKAFNKMVSEQLSAE